MNWVTFWHSRTHSDLHMLRESSGNRSSFACFTLATLVSSVLFIKPEKA